MRTLLKQLGAKSEHEDGSLFAVRYFAKFPTVRSRLNVPSWCFLKVRGCCVERPIKKRLGSYAAFFDLK